MISLARPCLAVGIVFFGLLLSAGCKRDNSPDTGIIVEVTTDLHVPGDLNQVHLTAKNSQGNLLHEQTFDLGEGANLVLPPFRVGIYPMHDAATTIHIEAVGQLDSDSNPVVSHSATLSFVHGKKVVLELPLLAVCKPVKCTVAFQTCKANGKCDSDTVDSSGLPAYVPNRPVSEPDAATVIADAQTPVSPIDAAAEKTADVAADRALDFAMDAAEGRDAFFPTGGADGADSASGTGGAIGTDAGTAAVDVRTEVGDTPGSDAPLDVSVGGSGGTGGTTPMGGTTASGGKTTAGGTTASGGIGATGGSTGGVPTTGGIATSGGTNASGGTTSAGGTTTTGGTVASGGTTSAGGTTTAGGTTASGGTTSSGGTTTAGGTTASGGNSGSGGASVDGGTPPPSCSGLAATCGPAGNGDCCASLLVPGNLPGENFYRSYDGVTYTDKSYPATVADFYLDKYEITVGRFRQFVKAGMGTQSSSPASGTGAHPLITGSGWDSTWNTNLAATTAALTANLKCNSGSQTWTDTAAGGNESRPQNCISWYEAFAFCAWDGGRLATEAEWNYAAAGGSEQREYPWGSGTDYTKASYDCMGDGNTTCALTDLIVVGSKPAGNGKWGHADLAGNVWELTLDWYASSYSIPCDNCADLAAAYYRVVRGGDFNGIASLLRSANRDGFVAPDGRYNDLGARCARNSL